METEVKYAVNGDEFIIKDYNNAKAFASFLPAISGLWGKPMWVYYVNRGQAIANFGVRDKDGAIMEFIAANKAWRQTSLQGFRTFYKANSILHEPFRCVPYLKSKKISQTMYIKAHSVRLIERNEESGIESEALFCTMPNENFPALLRQLTIKNISSAVKKIECIDGLPVLTPWGTNNWMLKNLSRLAEGWFAGVNFTSGGIPYYKLPVEPLDRPEIVPVLGAHFYSGYVKEQAAFPQYCVDPDTVFGQQTDFCFPARFIEQDIFTIDTKISGKNKTPSAMGYFSINLSAGEQVTYHSMIGYCSDVANIDKTASMLFQNYFFETKEKENEKIISDISSCVYTESAFKQFDAYCKQNFIDNVLRGGFPVSIGENISYHAYSRVHGDMEREYNNFVVLSEYFSQGNGNYRDINQNRRNDVFFNREIGDDNIQYFMNLIQTDGFNPLAVLGVRFAFETEDKMEQFLKIFSRSEQLSDGFIEKLRAFINVPLTIGSLFNFIEDDGVVITDKEALLSLFLKYTNKTGHAIHGEGFWSDHWHYNTDLIESYLAIFPDRISQLFLDRRDYTYYDNNHFVEPRSAKYVLFKGKPVQLRAVCPDPEKTTLISSRAKNPNTVRANYGTGDVYYTNLLGKLMGLIANKYASLDPQGLGIEMESDKPNWCDALNGLPGIFGSSCAESLELLRLISFLKQSLSAIKLDTTTLLAEEVTAFIEELVKITDANLNDYDFWDKTHTVKEDFREKTRLGLSGKDKDCTINQIIEILSVFEQKLAQCQTKIEAIASDGIVPTCFAFIPDSWEIDENAESKLTPSAKARRLAISVHGEKISPIIIHSFKRRDLPLFLEGPVHYLRLCQKNETAKEFHQNMLKSPLYDKKLDMIKNNAPVANAGQDLGRITVFTPGWLENESIWLHMEYKYLLELLRNGLADEFFAIAKTTLIPFCDPAVYGRSIYENTSFLVSSAHPDESIHGQGFVARLSGATAEFISIWLAMTSGLKPFSMDEGELCLTLQPTLPANFFTEAKTFTFNFLGACKVVYHNEANKNTFGKDAAQVQSYRVHYNDGAVEEITGNRICGKSAVIIREGKAKRIDIFLK